METKKEFNLEEKMEWKCHTPNLLKEINECTNFNNSTVLNIFKNILVELSKRCSELNDPFLNNIMCRLTLYEIADPNSKDYDYKKLQEIKKLAKEEFNLEEKIRKINIEEFQGEYCFKANSLKKKFIEINKEFIDRLISGLMIDPDKMEEFYKLIGDL